MPRAYFITESCYLSRR